MHRRPSAAMRAAAAEAANLRPLGAPRYVTYDGTDIHPPQPQPPPPPPPHHPIHRFQPTAPRKPTPPAHIKPPLPDPAPRSPPAPAHPQNTPRPAVDARATQRPPPPPPPPSAVTGEAPRESAARLKRPPPQHLTSPRASAVDAPAARPAKRPRPAVEAPAPPPPSAPPVCAAPPSAVAEAPSPDKLSPALIEQYALLVVERHPATAEPDWLACKFCPWFGCTRRNINYIKAYGSPFNVAEFEPHLDLEHRDKWVQFRSASEPERAKLLESARPLPDMHVFEARVKELKRCWGNTREERAAFRSKGKEAKMQAREKKRTQVIERREVLQGFEVHESLRALQASTKGQKDDVPALSSRPSFFSSRERSAGRSFLATEEGEGDPVERGRVLKISAAHSMTNKFGKLFLFPSLVPCAPEIPELVINGDLRDGHPRKRRQMVPLCMPGSYLPPDQRAGLRTRDLFALQNQAFSAVVLFYLLRGIPLGIIEMWLKGMLDISEEDSEIEVHGQGEKYPSEVSDGEGKRQEAHDISERNEPPVARDHHHEQDEPISNVVDDDGHENAVQNESGDVFDDSRDDTSFEGNISAGLTFHIDSIEDSVWNCGNSICVEGLRILRGLMDVAIPYWATLLTTRRCPEAGEGAIEVMISWHQFTTRHHWFHLVSVRPVEGAGDVVVRILDCICVDWRKRLLGIKSGLSEGDVTERKCEAAIFSTLAAVEGVSSDLKYVPLSGSEGNKEIVPFCLPGISAAGLAKVIKENETRYLLNFRRDEERQETEAKTLLYQRRELFERHSGPVIDASVDWSDAVVMIGQIARAATGLIEGLSLVWSAGLPSNGKSPLGCRRTGLFFNSWKESKVTNAVVDVAVERTLWARTLVLLSALENRPIDCRVGPPNRAYEKMVANVWGANWSNREKTAVLA